MPARYTHHDRRQAVDASRAILVTVANSAQFGNGARIAPGARVDDGLLDLVVVEERCAAGARSVSCRGCSTAPSSGSRGCSIRRIQRGDDRIATEPMTFHVDGEPVEGGTRLQVRVHPGALRVAVR